MALTTNLVSYWKLDEASGNAADSVSSNTLTNNGTAVYNAGKINNGIDFGSANTTKYLNYTAGNLGVRGNTDKSISFWVNVTTAPTSGNVMYLVDHNDATTDNVWHNVAYVNNSGTLQLQHQVGTYGIAGGQDARFTQTLTTGTWYHIVYTYVQSSLAMTLYVNGSSVSTATSAGGTGSLTLPVNGFLLSQQFNTPSGGSYLSGHIDEVGFWSRALTSGEVTSLYNGGAGLAYPFTTSVNSGFFFAAAQ